MTDESSTEHSFDESFPLNVWISLRAVSLSCIGVILANIVTMFASSFVLPFRREGARQVVAMPWETFAFVMLTVPVVVVYLTSFIFVRRWQLRIAILAVAGIAEFVWFESFGCHLLRRYFIGKL